MLWWSKIQISSCVSFGKFTGALAQNNDGATGAQEPHFFPFILKNGDSCWGGGGIRNWLILKEKTGPEERVVWEKTLFYLCPFSLFFPGPGIFTVICFL